MPECAMKSLSLCGIPSVPFDPRCLRRDHASFGGQRMILFDRMKL